MNQGGSDHERAHRFTFWSGEVGAALAQPIVVSSASDRLKALLVRGNARESEDSAYGGISR